MKFGKGVFNSSYILNFYLWKCVFYR